LPLLDYGPGAFRGYETSNGPTSLFRIGYENTHEKSPRRRPARAFLG
jgi:hypothetical protein